MRAVRGAGCALATRSPEMRVQHVQGWRLDVSTSPATYPTLEVGGEGQPSSPGQQAERRSLRAGRRLHRRGQAGRAHDRHDDAGPGGAEPLAGGSGG